MHVTRIRNRFGVNMPHYLNKRWATAKTSTAALQVKDPPSQKVALGWGCLKSPIFLNRKGRKEGTMPAKN